VYSTKVNGETLSFGTSGFLYRNNKLMYDRGTKSLWNQFYGRPVVGALAESGIELEVLPVLLTRWSDWLNSHPDTTVLDNETGVYPASTYEPETDPNSAYFEYRQDPDALFPVWERSDLLHPKAQVLGLNVSGRAGAYPLDILRDTPVINDSLGGTDLVVITTADSAARAYERGGETFAAVKSPADSGATVLLEDDDGDRWRVDEEALTPVGHSADSLRRLPSHIAYWVGWFAFYPGTALYDGS